jgi:small subunit ribosomal protein S17
MKITSKKKSKDHEYSGKIIRKTENTVIVEVQRQVKHIKYGKILNMGFKYMAHNPNNKCNIGDVIKIKPCRPYSRRKTWLATTLIHKSI